MVHLIHYNELSGVNEILTDHFGMGLTQKEIEPSFWVLSKQFLRNTDADRSSSSCYAIRANESFSQACTSLKGMICKTEIFGGSLHYKNGTHVHVGVNDVNRFCNPQSNEYDEFLDLCLIKFTNRRLL